MARRTFQAVGRPGERKIQSRCFSDSIRFALEADRQTGQPFGAGVRRADRQGPELSPGGFRNGFSGFAPG